MTAKSQKSLIREYLEAGNSITPEEARVKFGCGRLSARVGEINVDLDREYNACRIVCKMIPITGFNGKKKMIGQYRMTSVF